jgi:hypothetical protein
VLKIAPILPLSASAIAKAAPAGGQVIKPGGSTDRLPAPATITAVQQPDGHIRVTWSAVDGAVSYTLARSVPPTPIAPVTLPNPSDTVYVDLDVKPGSTYYYLVAAVNEAGLPGLKRGSPPVTATAPGVAQPPSPPSAVKAVLSGSTATVSWAFLQGMHYPVQRGIVTSTGSGTWQPVNDIRTCCGFSDKLDAYPPGTRVTYRVTAVDSKGMQSQPAMSNEITTPSVVAIDTATTTPPATPTTTVRPAVVAEPSTIKVGDPLLKVGGSSSFTNLQLQKTHWLSLDESVATVDSKGQVRARAAGFTYIVALGTTPDGSVASMVKRVDVR